MKVRLRRVILVLIGALLFAVLYVIFWKMTGIGFVCPIQKLFGLDCPGCGITRALWALLRLDFRGMLSANLLSPLIIGYIGYSILAAALFYVKKGKIEVSYRPAWANLCLLILFLAYGVLRNLIEGI